MASIEKKYTKILLDRNRFEVQNVSGLRNIPENVLQIIDKDFNRRYFYKYSKNFNLLIDSLNKTYCVLDIQGKDTDDIYSIIPDFPLDLETFNRDLLLSNGIEMNILDTTYSCFMHKNNEIIQENLTVLNNKLKTKCPYMRLVFDNYYNLKGQLSLFFDNKYDTYILCLYYKENCISSIMLEFKDNKFEINSNTHPHYDNNKYNKLLRCVIIIICYNFICNNYPISELVSYPVNPISSWLLISNFDTTAYTRKVYNGPLIKIPFDTNIDKEGTKKKIIANAIYIEQITVPLNKTNLEKALILFDILINLEGQETIICPPPDESELKHGGYRAYSKYLKYKSKLKSLH